jgi:predicted O-methyltransferase YrrM
MFLSFYSLALHSQPARGSFTEFSQWMNPTNPRYETFQKGLALLEARNGKMIVETGTTRGVSLSSIFTGDGGSSILFGSWAKKHNAMVYSVDICAAAFDNAKPFVEVYAEHFFPVCADSVAFLERFEGTIDFLYLDSFDFEAGNPQPSQEHHLKEIIAAYPKLTTNSVILIDDCGLPHGGKGRLAIDYLQKRGWKILINRYQVLLIHNNSNL